MRNIIAILGIATLAMPLQAQGLRPISIAAEEISAASTAGNPPAATRSVSRNSRGIREFRVSENRSFRFTLSSPDAEVCQILVDGEPGGASVRSGLTLDVTPGSRFYPAEGRAKTLTFVCIKPTPELEAGLKRGQRTFANVPEVRDSLRITRR